MRLIGFVYNKINVEKKSELKKEININTNIDVLDIKELKSDMINTKEKLVKIEFKYNVSYSPDYADITLIGEVVLSLDSELYNDVLKDWKEKKVPVNFKISLFNLIIKKAGIKALELEEEMNLPYHIPFPSIQKAENPAKK